MQSRSYQSDSLIEGTVILSREWSRHRLSVQRGEDLRLRFSIRSITPHMSLSTLAYGTQVMVLPEDRADVLLLQMPRAGHGRANYSWGHAAMDPGHYALINVQQVAQAHYSRDLDMLVLRIAMPRVMEHLAQALGHRPTQALAFQPTLARGSEAWEAWAPVAAALEALQRSTLAQFPAPALAALEDMVLSTLLLAQPHNHRDALLRPIQSIAPHHVRLAEEFIHAHLNRPLNTADIARHARVSVRALFDGFRRFRQTTPAAYVRQARLAAAREDLLRGGNSIASVAERWGFPHAGHFAAQYRRQYGETPAQAQRLRSPLH